MNQGQQRPSGAYTRIGEARVTFADEHRVRVRKILVVGFAILLALALIVYDRPVYPEVNMADTGGNPARFAVEMYRNLLPVERAGKNLLVSTAVVRRSLEMTMRGARGQTYKELEYWLGDVGDVFHSAGALLLGTFSQAGDRASSATASSLFVDSAFQLREDFQKDMEEHFKCPVQSLNMSGEPEASRIAINSWVANQTSGLVESLLGSGSVDEQTRLIIANAIHFKAKWAEQFPAHRTHDDTFHNENGSKVQVKMMEHRAEFGLAYDVRRDVDIVRLPYQGDQLSMVLVVPRKHDGLREVEESLTAELLQYQDFEPTKMDLVLPRFHTDASFDLKPTLERMGIVGIFSRDSCDLSGMSTTSDLFVSQLVHKVVIEVDEQGTEAAGAAGVVIQERSIPPLVEANRPFLYAIRVERTKELLFIGRVARFGLD